MKRNRENYNSDMIKLLVYVFCYLVTKLCLTLFATPRAVACQAPLSMGFPRQEHCQFSSVEFSSVAQSCLTLCDPVNRSMPGLPVHHQLPEFTRLTSIESVMPSSHLILCCSFSSFPQSLSASVFSNESTLLIRWPKYWSFSFSISPSNKYSGLISFRMDWLDLLAPRDSQESFPTPQFKSINSLVLSFLYSPTLTSIHDYWKKHSLD